MRPDMGKCVIERPRRGSSWKSSKVRDYGKFVKDRESGEIDYEGLTRIPASSKGALLVERDRKDFSDVLGPLENYLRSSCGRLWDDVYSEIAYNLGRFTKQQGIRHIIKAHLNVATNTYRGVDGNVWECGAYGVNPAGGYRNHFYVEPETGILREEGDYRKWYEIQYRRPYTTPAKPVTNIPIYKDENVEKYYEKIEGIWYYFHIQYVEYKYFVAAGNYRMAYYETRKLTVGSIKRQLNKKELKKLKLRNG